MQNISVRCCIAGGGPAGVMVGLLLARAGIDVVVLEKHADFFRDFRGDTIHPSTLELMHELGCLDELLKLPHQKARQVGFQFGNTSGIAADFSGVKLHAPYIAIMPQWDFLDFLARRGARYPTFSIKMNAEVTDIIEENAPVVGVTATTPRGPLEVRADLVIAADGRHSLVREKAGLAVDDLGAPMDVLWFSIPRKPSDPEDTMGRFDAGRILVAINRSNYWQMGYVIPKGTLDTEERLKMESHVTSSYNFLKGIPWTPLMKNIPTIAWGHHEKLDGSGYPRGLKSADIPLQTKMMTISDIYDALTAANRPYKRAMPAVRALDILHDEAVAGKLDRELLDVFTIKHIYELTPHV